MNRNQIYSTDCWLFQVHFFSRSIIYELRNSIKMFCDLPDTPTFIRVARNSGKLKIIVVRRRSCMRYLRPKCFIVKEFCPRWIYISVLQHTPKERHLGQQRNRDSSYNLNLKIIFIESNESLYPTNLSVGYFSIHFILKMLQMPRHSMSMPWNEATTHTHLLQECHRWADLLK